MIRELILIDGLPGSGKSSLAQGLAASLGNAGTLLETDPDHPLHPVSTDEIGAAWPLIHEQISAEEFADQSLGRWQRLLREPDLPEVAIVESFPFQSSIRVLLQIDAPRSLIDEYWLGWQYALATTPAHIVYLKAADSTGLINRIAERRGSDWKRYIGEAFQQMPFSIHRGLSGWEAVERFLSAYQSLIEELMLSCRIPLSTFEAEPDDYDARLGEVLKKLRPAA